jgi:hypothetical protein
LLHATFFELVRHSRALLFAESEVLTERVVFSSQLSDLFVNVADGGFIVVHHLGAEVALGVEPVGEFI